MSKKIEVVGNFLIVTDTVSGVRSPQPMPLKEMGWNDLALEEAAPRVVFETNRFLSESTEYELYPPFLLSVAVDTNDVAFTKSTFRDFCSLNLGKSSPESGANRVVVNQSNIASTLGGTIDSTKEYFIDGVINCNGITIEVPSGGFNLKGYDFVISKLLFSDTSSTLFTSPVGGSGDFIGADYAIEVTGANSKVYDLKALTGNEAFEFSRVNYNNCTSLGSIENYRQGLETGTGRFGGSPSIELIGIWLGGYRISTSIVRGMSDTTTEPLFKAGTGFVMNSRFLTDINCDLGTLQPFLDFSDTNFPNPSTLELRDVLLTRDGVIDANDTNYTPNISADNLSCSWKGNNGIPNTFVGAIATITTEVLTGIIAINVPSLLAGTYTNTDMQHFDSPSNGQLRHLGDNPREYTVNFDFVLDGSQNNDYKIELVKDSGGVLSSVYQQTRVINNLQGGRDVAYFTGLANLILNKNEFVYWQVRNESGSGNCTLELDSSWSVEER